MDCLTQHTMDYQIVSIECDLDTLSMPWKCVLYLPRAINSLVLSYSDAFRYRLAGVIDPTKPGDLIKRELNEVMLVCRKIARSRQTSDEIALLLSEKYLRLACFNRDYDCVRDVFSYLLSREDVNRMTALSEDLENTIVEIDNQCVDIGRLVLVQIELKNHLFNRVEIQ